MSTLAGGVYAVTGGASGMGLAICRLLAQSKARAICIGDFNDAAFEEVKVELRAINASTDVDAMKVNVSDPLSVKTWMNCIIEKYDALDGAANCAGVAQQVGARQSPAILEETDDTWTRTIGVNLNGVFYCCREEIRSMMTLKKKPRAIVNIASIAALIHGSDCYAYGVSKSSVVYFTSGLAKDVAPFNIRVNCVSPGATATPMLAQFFPPSMQDGTIDTGAFGIIQPSDIANAVCYLLSSQSSAISGVNIPVGTGAP